MSLNIAIPLIVLSSSDKYRAIKMDYIFGRNYDFQMEYINLPIKRKIKYINIV